MPTRLMGSQHYYICCLILDDLKEFILCIHGLVNRDRYIDRPTHLGQPIDIVESDQNSFRL